MKRFLILLFLVALGAPMMAADEAARAGQYAKKLAFFLPQDLSDLLASAVTVMACANDEDISSDEFEMQRDAAIDAFWKKYSLDHCSQGEKHAVAQNLPAAFGRPEVGIGKTAEEMTATDYQKSYQLISCLKGYCEFEMARREEEARVKETSPDAVSAPLSSEAASMPAPPVIPAPVTPAKSARQEESIAERTAIRNRALMENVFCSWQRLVANQKDIKARADEKVLQINKALKRQAFQGLATNVRDKKNKHVALERAKKLNQKHQLHKAFKFWEQAATQEKKQKKNVARQRLKKDTAALTSAFNEWVPVTNENKACLSSMLAKRNVAEKQRQKSALNAFKANVQKRKEARVILRSRLEAVERRGLTHGFTLWKKFNEHERTASGPLTSVDETPFSIESGLVTDTSAEEHMKGTDLLAGFDVVEKAEAASKLEDAAVSLEPVLGASGVIEAADSGRPAFTQKIKCKRTRPVFDELKRHVVLQHKKRIAQAMGQKHRTAQAFREWSQRAVRRVARNQVVVAMNALRNTKSKKEVFQALRRNTQEEKAKKTPVDIPHVGAPKVQPSVIQNTQVKPLSPQGPKRKKRDEAVVVEKAHLPTITEETTLSSYSSLSSRSESPTTIAALHPVTKEVVCDRTSTLPVKQRAVSPTKDYSSWLLGGGAAFIAAGVALLSGKRTAQGRLGVVVDALRSDSRLTFGEKVRALAGALALGAGVTLGSVGAYQKIAR